MADGSNRGSHDSIEMKKASSVTRSKTLDSNWLSAAIVINGLAADVLLDQSDQMPVQAPYTPAALPMQIC